MSRIPHTDDDFAESIARVVAILSPAVSATDPEAMPIFDWPKGVHPSADELRALAARIVGAVLNGTP
jgi:hypothetical protein